MPSPSIPRSKSAPRILTTPLSPSHSDVTSRWTSTSENSSRTWPKKVGNFIARKTGSSSSSKKSILTEESLKEFNRLNEILEQKRHFSSSPYYKGLTYSSLVISRQRPSLPSPDTESNAGSLMSSSSKTSFVYKMQEWGSSCFTSKDKEANISQPKSSSSNSKNFRDTITPIRSLSSSTLSKQGSTPATTNTRYRCTKTAKELGSESEKLGSISTKITSTTSTDAAIAILNKGKPLRERVLVPPSPPPTPPHPGPQIIPPAPAPAPTQILQPQPTLQPPQTSSRPTITPSQTSPTEKIVQEKETNKPENERKFMWADKYRPFALKDFISNHSKALELQATVKSENCSHFIFEGQPGVGKRTMIWAFLREAFGEDRVEAREESRKFVLKGEAVSSINVNIKHSSMHVEINLSELRGYEKHVIVELIKEKSDKSSSEALQCNPDNCRAIILYEVDKLPTEALLYIKWLLERYKGCNKLFFCCSDASKIHPLTSLCTLVQLLPPSTEEIIKVLEFIAQQEGITLPHQLAAKIAKSSKNNLRQAIRSFEATWQFNSVLKENQEIMIGWEDDIAKIARNIIDEQSPKQLYNIRGKLQNLIEHNVSPEFIFETLVKELKKNLDEQLQKQIDNLHEKYNKNDDCEKHYAPAPNRQEEMGKRLNDPVRKTVQQFMRIEEFIAKFMSWYKGLVVKSKQMQAHAI
ncbi:replication factor C subunit 3-like [Coffea eugenioides]|uniref:replication factor C subunit 3-like n=1 Tax=Coffea eugenioides TaxID=49369 RepID=UPI000F60B833|nr:replication factor C subunit 3-like [Coffea eugenioides]